jgi:hypothetical protein
MAAIILLLRFREAGGPVPAAQLDEASSAAAWADADWEVFEETSRWALQAGLDTLPLGEAMAHIGQAFVGTAYIPGTLEQEGPERLVINFRGLDCVTFVENVFALARFVRQADAAAFLAERPLAEDRYEQLLAELRYRGGTLDGYSSRLHYFVDWIQDNEARGNLRDVTEGLGGVLDREAVDFMSTHTDAYRQLTDADNVAAIRAVELRLTDRGRHFLPEAEIAGSASDIRNGDIIAATSTVPGLDVAHTGLALWVDGALHLLHAPLLGEAVQISEVSLAQRIARISGQDGVIVARPGGSR